MRRILSLIITAALALSLAACGAKDTPNADASQQGKPTLKVGMECAYAPFNWTQVDEINGAVALPDGTGFAGGYDVEIAKLLAEKLGMELEIVKTEWEGLLPGVTSGKIDLIIAGMSPTAERKESIDFSDVYYESDLVMVVKKDSPYANAKTLQDFKGAKVTGQLNTFHYAILSQMKDAAVQTAMEDFPTMVIAVTSGKIDGYVSERPGAVSAVTANPSLTFVEFEAGKGFEASPEDTAIAVGLKKGSELTAKINAILSEISREERIAIMDKAIANQPLNN